MSVIAVALAVGLLSGALIGSLFAAVWGDDSLNYGVAAGVLSWGVWGLVFYLYRTRVSERLDRILAWLIKGSVLELLIVVPCHIIVRQREDCSAPGATGLGIATGIAVMLMAFGPGILLLYQKRLSEYSSTGKS